MVHAILKKTLPLCVFGTICGVSFATSITNPKTYTNSTPITLSNNSFGIDCTSATCLGQNIPAANVAAGALGTSVIASSFTASGVTAGSYTNTNLTVDAQGRITTASNGSSSGLSGGAVNTLAIWSASNALTTVSSVTYNLSTGFMGIGAPVPASTLHVSSGSITLDGTTPAFVLYGASITLNGGNISSQGKGTGASDEIYGAGAGQSLTSAANDTFVGVNAGQRATTAGRCTFVGVLAGQKTTTGNTTSLNTAVGYNALNANTTGAENVAIGANAVSANTTGADNVGVGMQAVGGNSGASAPSQNTGIGAYSLNNITSGSNNVSLGYKALLSNDTGSANVAVGMQSGYGPSGTNAITSGYQNTFLGWETASGANNLTNATAIGALAQVNVSSAIVLGAVNGINGALAPTKVGIGTPSPVTLVHASSGTFFMDGNNPNLFLGAQGSTNTYSLGIATGTGGLYTIDVTTSNHVNFQNFPVSPVISSCGATPNGSVVGSDTSGTITIGGGVVTACTLTFSKPFTNTPVCVISDNSTAITGDISSLSKTAFTTSFSASLGGGTVYYHCFGSD